MLAEIIVGCQFVQICKDLDKDLNNLFFKKNIFCIESIQKNLRKVQPPNKVYSMKIF